MGLAYSLRQQPIYTTTARVIVVADPDQRPFADLAALFLSQRRARDFLTLLTSPALLQRAVVVYGLPTTAEDLRNNLTITSPRDTALIDITATAPTGELATKYVVTVAQEFVTAASELEKQGAVHVRIVDPAAVPPYRSRPRTAKNIVDAALALALVALVASCYRARRNPKLGYLPDLRTIGDVPVGRHKDAEKAWQVSILGEQRAHDASGVDGAERRCHGRGRGGGGSRDRCPARIQRIHQRAQEPRTRG
ncbi:YveK family protein [Mycolicibacter engbaekii]